MRHPLPAGPWPSRIAAALAAARRRDGAPFVGHLELYCEGADCPVRTVDVFVKELDEETPTALRCPACRRQLKLHHVRTFDEQRLEDQAEARASVNAQLYIERERQRLGDPGAIVPVPIGVVFDTRLPETRRTG